MAFGINPSAGGGVDPLDAMLKSVYDTTDNGIVDKAEILADKMILLENVTAGDLVYYTDAAPIGGIQSGGIASNDDVAKRPAIGVAAASGLTGETIEVVEAGLVEADTSAFNVGTIVSLGVAGALVSNPTNYNQQVGTVQISGVTGRLYLKQGSIEKAPIPPVALDGEMLRYDATVGGYQGTGDINSDAEVNFGDKDIITTGTMTSGTGTFKLGDSIGMSAAGENMTTTNLVDNDHFNPVWIKQSDNFPTARITIGAEQSLTQEASKADVLINPSWQSDPLVDWRVVKLTFEVDTTITNVRLHVTKGGDDFYSAILGTLTANVETTIDLTSTADNVPVDAFLGGVYIVSVTSVDGDVRCKGSTANLLPFFKVGYFPFEDKLSITEDAYAIESVATALISGGIVTQNTPSTIDITAGTGRIVSIDILGVPTVTQVSWDAIVGASIPNIGIDIGTRVTIDINGAYQPIAPELTPATMRDFINLAIVPHAAGIIGRIANSGLKSQEVYMQLLDNLIAQGVTRKSGLAVEPNANLTFVRTAGELESPGAGVDSGHRGQNIAEFAAESPAIFTRVLGITGDFELLQTLVDPGFFDNGSGTKVAIGAPAAQSTIVYVYQSVLTPGGLIVMYGQTVYDTLNDAIVNAPVEKVINPPLIQQGSNLIARIAIRSDATDLSDPLQAEILGGVKFGTGLEGVGLGNISGGGDVFGPASSVNGQVAVYDGVTGKVLDSDSGATCANGLMRLTSSAGVPDLELTNAGGTTLGGITHDFGGFGTIVYHGPNRANPTNAFTVGDTHSNTQKKLIVNSAQVARAHFQVGDRFSDPGQFTDDFDAPAYINNLVRNGGNVPLPGASTLILSRSGVGGQAYGNICRFDLSRYENVDTQSRTQMDIRLAHRQITTAQEGNNTPIIASFRSNGQMKLSGGLNTPDYALADSSNNVVGGLSYDFGGFGTFLYSGPNRASPVNALTVTDDHTNTGKKLIVGSAQDARANFQVGDRPVDGGGAFDEDLDSPAFIMNLNDNGGNTLAPPLSSLILAREGVTSQSWSNLARFDLSRYELAGADSRTQMDLRLSHGNLATEGNNTPIIMTFRSSGDVTIANSLTVNGIKAAQSTVAGRLDAIGVLNLSGNDVTVTQGTFNFYRLNGAVATPAMALGVYTVSETGVYELSLRSNPSQLTGSPTSDFVKMWISKNNANAAGSPNDVVQSLSFTDQELSAHGQLFLTVGDTLRLKHDSSGTSTWASLSTSWTLSKVSD